VRCGIRWTAPRVASPAIACGDPDGSVHSPRNTPDLLNWATLPLPASMVHRLPFWSTATTARLMKLPCEVLLPSIVARYLPLELNSWTTLVPASPTYTVPFVGPF